MSIADDLLTEEEAAEQLGFSRNWLRRKRLEGAGPKHIKLGNRVCYDESDIKDWLESLKKNVGENRE